MLNQAEVIGNLGGDPETRFMTDGSPVVNFSVATTDKWKDKQTGEKKEKTEWHRITIFSDGLCKIAQDYLRKGSKVYLQGKLQTRKWTDDKGSVHYTTEIVLTQIGGKMELLDGRQDGGRPDQAPLPDPDEEIPF